MLNCNKELQAFAYRQHKIKVFLAGDYEFPSTSYGLSGASGKKSIPYYYQHATYFRKTSMPDL